MLRGYALLIPMLYCDAITDAITKGLGQQKICVRYNILTSALDVVLLFFLLPKYGMSGYYVSFLASHLLNFILSLRRLLIITGERISFLCPLLTAAAAAASVWAAAHISAPVPRCFCYCALLGSLLTLLGVISREDAQWLSGLIRQKREKLRR